MKKFSNEAQDRKEASTQSRELLTGLAKVGITALIDEATGYQKVREKNALQKMLNKNHTKRRVNHE
jgi:hypothetical protein